MLLVVVTLLAAICYAQSQGAKTLVLERNEGETRVRRPHGALPTPSAEFILKVTPENSGSKHLVLGTEEIPPGGVIPKHKHLEQDEILLIQTGTAHVTLDDKEYDVHAGGTVFFPAQTWVGLKNTGTDNISLVFIFSAPGFEKNMRCGSVLAGQTAPPINTSTHLFLTGLALLPSWRGKLFGGLDCWGLELFDFPTDEIFDLDVREVIEPNSP